MIYLDTSALIKLYILEDGSETVQALIEAQDDPLPIWEIQEAELANALRLKVFWGDLTDRQADEQLALFEQRRRSGQYFFPELDRPTLLESFRLLSRETGRLGCRTLDILHVACALQLRASAFVSFDERQRALAVHAGLRVLPSS